MQKVSFFDFQDGYNHYLYWTPSIDNGLDVPTPSIDTGCPLSILEFDKVYILDAQYLYWASSIYTGILRNHTQCPVLILDTQY